MWENGVKNSRGLSGEASFCRETSDNIEPPLVRRRFAMIGRLIFSLALIGALLCACGTHGPAALADGPDDELKKFQGTWIVTAYTKDGSRTTP